MADKLITRLDYRQPVKVPVEQVASSMYDGWHDLVAKMLNDLFDLGWDGQLRQIKEKFGSLRVYVLNTDEAINARIAEAEDESTRTCRVCGAPGELRHGGWIKVLCDKHEAIRR